MKSTTPARTRYRIQISGGGSVWGTLRLFWSSLKILRMMNRYGPEAVADALRRASAGSPATSVRTWTEPCPSVSPAGLPCANGAGHLALGIRHGDPFKGASGVNWDDPEDYTS